MLLSASALLCCLMLLRRAECSGLSLKTLFIALVIRLVSQLEFDTLNLFIYLWWQILTQVIVKVYT